MNKNMDSLSKYIGNRYVAPGLATLAMLGMAGCGSDNESKTVTRTVGEAAPQQLKGPTGRTAKELAASIARISREVKGKDITPPPSFCENTDKEEKRQKMYSKTPARLIVNTLCQPPLGEPATLYDAASFKSEPLGTVNDGDVVTAKCIDPDGQPTTDYRGPSSRSDTWVQVSSVEAGGDKITGYLSEVNLGYVDDNLFKICEKL